MNKIKGVSQKGKNRVREHGTFWETIEERSSVACLNNKVGRLLKASDGYLRWMAIENDKDFENEKG